MSARPDQPVSATAHVSVALATLSPAKILETAGRLKQRIGERFPEADLVDVCSQLVDLASRARVTTDKIRRPHRGLRLLSYSVVALVVAASFIAVVSAVRTGTGESFGWAELVQVGEAAINDVVLIGAAIYFTFSFERRFKRGQIVAGLHQLRTLAHLIDVHQLTMNPEAIDGHLGPTPSSPTRALNRPQMARYLDYCSEMLALTGKIAALYGDRFDDADSLEAVTAVEDLCIGLSGKIWQKVVILELRLASSA